MLTSTKLWLYHPVNSPVSVAADARTEVQSTQMVSNSTNDEKMKATSREVVRIISGRSNDSAHLLDDLSPLSSQKVLMGMDPNLFRWILVSGDAGGGRGPPYHWIVPQACNSY